jgi:hypothetical protein
MSSVQKAEGWIEPIDVKSGDFVVYDSVGRLLKIDTNWKGNRISAVEAEPSHRVDLEHSLRRFLKASNVPQADDPSYDLAWLVQACCELA